MRRVIGYHEGQPIWEWMGEGSALGGARGMIRGEIVVGGPAGPSPNVPSPKPQPREPKARVLCEHPMKTGVCAKTRGHTTDHMSRAAMDAKNARVRAA